MAKKRYVQVGVGSRAQFFYRAIGETFSETAEITAFCDINRTRLEYARETMMKEFHYPDIALYMSDEFEKMIEEQKPDYVIVTSIDRTHHKYIIKAMEMGCAAVMSNTAIATAGDIPAMAGAFKQAIEAGRTAYLSGMGRILEKASASSPLTGFLAD